MLLLPTGWFIFIALSPALDTTRFAGLIWTLAIVIFLAAIGYILSILAWLLDNEGVTRSPAYRNRLMVIVLFVAIAGYLVGTFHPHFVFCQQFQIAGDAVPADCAASGFWSNSILVGLLYLGDEHRHVQEPE